MPTTNERLAAILASPEFGPGPEWHDEVRGNVYRLSRYRQWWLRQIKCLPGAPQEFRSDIGLSDYEAHCLCADYLREKLRELEEVKVIEYLRQHSWMMSFDDILSACETVLREGKEKSDGKA